MPVPSFRGPGYSAALGEQLAEGGAGRLKALLDSRAIDVDLLKSLMSNSEKLASIGGSGLLSTIASREAGSAPDLFASPYATTADERRARLEEATIGQRNRAGTGGGGGGSSGDKIPLGYFVGTDGILYKYADMENLKLQEALGGPAAPQIAIPGRRYEGALPAPPAGEPTVPKFDTPSAAVAAPAGGVTTEQIVDPGSGQTVTVQSRVNPATGKKEIADPGSDVWYEAE